MEALSIAKSKALEDKLNDVKDTLVDIQRLNGEIHKALDLIEQRRNEQDTGEVHTGPATTQISSKETVHPKQASSSDSSENLGTDKKPTILLTLKEQADVFDTSQDLDEKICTTSEVLLSRNQQTLSKSESAKERGPSTSSGEIAVAETKIEDMSQRIPKGILRKPNQGHPRSYGFKERLDLNEKHVMYGSQLRRVSVELHQDNRLCDRFDLHPNIGSVYESKRQHSDIDEGEGQTNPLQGQTDAVRNVSICSRNQGTTSGNHHTNSGLERGKGQLNTNKRKKDTGGKSSTRETPSSESSSVADVQRVVLPFTMEGGQNSREELIEQIIKMQAPLLASLGLGEDEIRRQVTEQVYGTLDENGQINFQHCLENLQSAVHLVKAGSEALAGLVSSSSTDNKTEVATTGLKLEPVPLSEESTEDETEEELVTIDASQWIYYANQEIEKGRIARDIRERGMDTIFCLDTSRSMKGVGWQQAIDFIKQFIDGIQDSVLVDDVYEHVALVTYGSQTCVQQHLTCDYLEVTRKLDRLKPSGTSPMYAGLQMVHATVIGSGAVFVTNGYKVHPRVFLVTDGKPTPTEWASGPDKCSHSEFLMEHIPVLGLVNELHEKFHITINPVPVGNFERSLLERIATASKGKIVSPADSKMQSQTFKNYILASQIGAVAPELSGVILDAVAPSVSAEDRVQMEEFLKTHKRGSGNDNSDDEERDNLPPLGSRVKLQSPRPHYSNLSLAEPVLGTVTKHMSDGFVGITWDRARENGSLHEKVDFNEGQGCLEMVDTPRLLTDEMIAVGCHVKRGADWRYNEQDGGAGNIGAVFNVNQNGVVKVRWSNGHKNSYRFGAEGKFDLEVVGQKKPAVEHTKRSQSPENVVEKMNQRNIMEMASVPQTDNTGSVGNAQNVAESLRSFEDIMNARNANNEQHDVNPEAKRSHSGVPKTETDLNARTAKQEHSVAEGELENVTDSEKRGLTRFPVRGADQNPESTGARQKTSTKKKMVQVDSAVLWLWKDGDEWQPFPEDICCKIENDYKNNSKGTTVVRLNDTQYRIVFPRMEQINIKTKEKQSVLRKLM